MYSVENKKKGEYHSNYIEYGDEYEEYDDNNGKKQNNNFWTNKSLIIKIAIIVLCVIILIYLIANLNSNGKNNKEEDPTIYNQNIESFRLVSEKYFFLDENMPKDGSERKVTLQELIRNNYISNLVDCNQKTCDVTTSYSSLKKVNDNYVMTLKLVCSSENKDSREYLYTVSNRKCLNCDGKTFMDGSYNNKEYEELKKYSCTNWSDWTSERVSITGLTERNRVLVKAYKKGEMEEKVTYGEWSEYSVTPITESEGIEVETKTEEVKKWSPIKTTTSKVEKSDTLNIVDTYKKSSGSTSYCPSGYTKENDKCISEKTKTGDLTYLEYNSSSYQIVNKPCGRVYSKKNDDGTYSLMYSNCEYHEVTDLKKKSSSSYTVYEYQTLETITTVYYRSRSVKKEMVKGQDIYLDNYMLEEAIPSGYEKVLGSEKIEYSYKRLSCEK